MNNFEAFLRTKADKLEKIENEDEFNAWIERLDVETCINYADEYGREITKEVGDDGGVNN